jgi:hypothetical protein
MIIRDGRFREAGGSATVNCAEVAGLLEFTETKYVAVEW